MPTAAFHGVFPYIVSPLKNDGHIAQDILHRLCDDLIRQGVHGLAPLGSTGEFAYLNPAQRQSVVETVVAASAGRVPVVAGVASTSTTDAVAQARQYERMGCDGIIAVLEAYFPIGETGVYQYFKTIADSTSLPVIIYTNPNFQRSDLSLAVIKQLSHVPNILYLKDASTNTGRLLSIMNAVGDRMKVFAASSHVTAAVMLMGGAGWMAGPACLAPASSVRLYNLCRQGDWPQAMALQRRLWFLNEVFSRYNLAACIKGGLTLQGYDVGQPVAPQAALDDAALADVKGVLTMLESAFPIS